MKTTEKLLSEDACREALFQFWTEQTEIVETGEGLALALPLLYPDGWQVQLFVEPVSRDQAILTDQGRTLGWLQDQRVNWEGGQTGELLQSRLEAFELKQDGFELQRRIRLPLGGLDVHLFGEALVAIAHLAYRHEAHCPAEGGRVPLQS